MEQKETEKARKQRLHSGAVLKQDVTWLLAKLAFGKTNDCVRLVLEEDADLKKLDLCLLAEVRRSEKGAVEIKLIDRLQVLKQLAQLMEQGSGGVDSFLQALHGGEEG